MRASKVTDRYPMYLPPPDTPRSVGIHASGIIRCIATEAGILSPQYAEELSLVDVRVITDPVAILRISIGLAWEKHYIPLLLDVVDHPGEMCLDGIYMTHDGESVSSVMITPVRSHTVLMCHEIKATYKSTRTVGDDLLTPSNWLWLTQIKAYCKGLGTRYACLHVLFLCGDYTYPIKPIREVWEIEFTQEEIDDTWSLLRDYRDARLANGSTT